MLSVAKEDLEALKKRKFRLVFVLGGPGTGKGTQCAKLVNEYKYIHVSTGDLIRDQIKKKTQLGEMCVSYTSKGQLVPFELIISILVKAIVSSNGKNFLIDGFPRSMEQALYFEKHIREMSIILNIHAGEEVSVKRILGRGAASTDKRQDDLDEKIIRNRLKEFRDQSAPVIDFYQRYGLVRNINSELDVGEVYENVKQSLYPAVYCIIGKKYSGKTTISALLAQRMGLKVIDFKDFINSEAVAKKKDDDAFVISKFITKLREEETSRVLIEDFPLKKEHHSLFVKNCKKINKIFYLNVDDHNATTRMNKIPYTDPNYIGCSKLNKELFNFDQKKDYINYLKNKNQIVEINVNNHLNLVMNDVVATVAPSILLFSHNQSDSKSKEILNQLFDYFKSEKYGYEIINVQEILKENADRFTQLGKLISEYLSQNKEVPIDLTLEALKPILFKESCNKYILVNFPRNVSDLVEFEKKICQVERMIYANTNESKLLPIEENSVELYMKKEHRFCVYRKSDIDDYQIDELVGKTRDVNVVFGRPYEGKTCLVNHLAKKYNYKLIDFVELIKTLKTEKGNKEDPPQDWESVDLTYNELLDGFKLLINNTPLNQKICLENLFNELTVEVNQVKALFDITGRPRIFYHVKSEDIVLLDRYKAKKEITEDLNEDQQVEYQDFLSKPKEITDFLNSISYKVVPVNTSLSEYKSLLVFDAQYGRNVAVIKHDYGLGVDDTLDLIAAKYQALYVNVPRLIYQQFYNNNDWAQKLENTYNKKTLKVELSDNSSAEERIYIKYNPIHFDENVVNELIFNFINKHSREIEETGNFVILSGYLNNDLLLETDLPFNLPLYEVNKMLGLGEVTAFLQFTRQSSVPVIDTEEPEQIVIEVPKPKPKDPLDVDADAGDMGDMGDNNDAGDNGDNKDNMDEDEEGKPKFKPENFAWTHYDGNPRNYIQTLMRLKKLPFEECSLPLSDAKQSLFSAVEKHINNWEDTTYGGVINLTKII